MKLEFHIRAGQIVTLSNAYLSSDPPSLRAMFRREKMAPNINLASSCALNLAGLARAGPRSGGGTGGPLLVLLEPEIGRAEPPPADNGLLSCLAHSFE